MKKFLLYLVVAIVIIFCGVSIYYVVRNDENIVTTRAENEVVYLNISEEIEIPVKHERANKETKLEINASSEIIEIDEENWSLKAVGVGSVKLVISPTNHDFGPFEFTINVGNGSIEYPFYIRNEDDLQQIGSKKYALTGAYQLVSDIEITKAFNPIASTENPFNGVFDGAGYKISGLEIDDNDDTEESFTKTQPLGLFRSVGPKGRVENLTLENAKVSGSSKFAGIIAGRNYGLIGKCQIYNSYISNSLNQQAYTGMACGLNETTSSYAGVRLCTIKGEITSNYCAGGLVGYNKGGVITNNNVEIVSASVTPDENKKNESLFGGICAYSQDAQGDLKQSVIFNNLIVIDNLNAGGITRGGLFGAIYSNSDETRGYYSMLLYNSSALLKPVGLNINEAEISNNSTSARNYSANLTSEEVFTRATYTGISSSSWEFSSKKNPAGKWVIEVNKSISINYGSEELTYQALPTIGTTFEISDNATLKTAISNMVLYPSAKITYIIKGSSERKPLLDEDGKEALDDEGNVIEEVIEKNYTYNCNDNWTPIGTIAIPFAGRIVAEDDATITIRNLKVESEYAGFFGVVDQDAEITNVIISSAKLSGTMVGGVCAMHVSGIIKNCKVLNAEITATKYAGGIAGFGVGTIEECHVSNLKIKVLNETERNIYLAGIIGKTRGIITKSIASSISIDVNEIESKENTICFGGISGYVEKAKIVECEAVGFDIEAEKYLGRAYAGGVVGYAINSTLKTCGVNIEETANIICLNQSHTYSLVGGLVGFLSEGKISYSSVGTIEISAYYAAGLVSFLNGEIECCYAGITTAINGNNVGGFVCNNHGVIQNSYTIANLNGSEKQAGMSTYLWKNAKIDHCYTYCGYLGKGKSYADTSSNYKSRKDLFGEITNSIFVGANDQVLAKRDITDFYKEIIICRDGSTKVEVQITYAFIANRYNFISEEALVGVEDEYALFKDLGFNEKIWSFESISMELKNSPTLIDCYDSGFGFIEEEKEVQQDQEEKTEASFEQNVDEGNTQIANNKIDENEIKTKGGILKPYVSYIA